MNIQVDSMYIKKNGGELIKIINLKPFPFCDSMCILTRILKRGYGMHRARGTNVTIGTSIIVIEKYYREISRLELVLKGHYEYC